MAGLFAVLAFIPEASWTDLLQHPIRVERLGEVPDTTIKGIRLLRLLLGVAGVAWCLQPFLQRRLDASLPVPIRGLEPQGGSGVLPTKVVA